MQSCEVYDFQEWSDESSSEDLEEEGGVPTFDANPQDAAPQSPKEWTWEMPPQDWDQLKSNKLNNSYNNS